MERLALSQVFDIMARLTGRSYVMREIQILDPVKGQASSTVGMVKFSRLRA